MLEELALAIADGKSYHVFTTNGSYTGKSFYFPGSAAAFVAGKSGMQVKYLTNSLSQQEVA